MNPASLLVPGSVTSACVWSSLLSGVNWSLRLQTRPSNCRINSNRPQILWWRKGSLTWQRLNLAVSGCPHFSSRKVNMKTLLRCACTQAKISKTNKINTMFADAFALYIAISLTSIFRYISSIPCLLMPLLFTLPFH